MKSLKKKKINPENEIPKTKNPINVTPLHNLPEDEQIELLFNPLKHILETTIPEKITDHGMANVKLPNVKKV